MYWCHKITLIHLTDEQLSPDPLDNIKISEEVDERQDFFGHVVLNITWDTSQSMMNMHARSLAILFITTMSYAWNLIIIWCRLFISGPLSGHYYNCCWFWYDNMWLWPLDCIGSVLPVLSIIILILYAWKFKKRGNNRAYLFGTKLNFKGALPWELGMVGLKAL